MGGHVILVFDDESTGRDANGATDCDRRQAGTKLEGGSIIYDNMRRRQCHECQGSDRGHTIAPESSGPD